MLPILFLFSWIVWGITLAVVFIVAMLIPWYIWEGFMYLTFNNVINFVSKIPTFLGWLIGFCFAAPFAIPTTMIAIWTYLQILVMGGLVITGDPNSHWVKELMDLVTAMEGSSGGSMFLVRFFKEHMQWLWGAGSILKSTFPWQNGVWAAVGEELSPPMMIIKLFILAIFYVIIFAVPILPIIWGLCRPIAGACSILPALMNNGDGRD
jgi:hypothetical protein